MFGKCASKATWMAMVAAVTSLSCVDPYPIDGAGADDSIGVVTLALTQVPSDARCIRLTSDAAGRRTVLTATLTPGAASFTTTFGGLPVGSQSLWADIYNVACTSLTATTVATWVSDPVPVVTTATTTPSVTLVVRRPGGVSVGVDFCTTSPCTSCSTGFHLCNGACVSNNSLNSCGTSCTPCPMPVGGTATCNGTSCGLTCNPGFHSCGAGTCFSDTDVARCGPGPSCTSCVQPNAIAACGSAGTCANTCLMPAYTLSCGPVGGKPNCSQWDFESNTIEGWALVTQPAGTSASGGALVATTAQHISGNAALAIPYNNQGDPNKYVEIVVKLCAGGNIVNLANKQLRYSFKMNPPQAAGEHYVTVGAGQGGAFDFNSDSDGFWDAYTNTLTSSWGQVTSIGFRFQATQSYNGTLYLDDIRIY